jgi:homopolymeric O-antigen transport system permease protein
MTSAAAKLGGRSKALWQYRGFVLGMVARDFRARYLGSVLGASWAIVNPLAQIAVYTLIFSQVMGARLPNVRDSFGYSLYLCAGILTWGYFVDVLQRSQTVFLEQANLLKKISFPRVTLPCYVFLSATVNFSISWGLFLAFLLVTGRWPGWPLLALIPLLLVQQVLAAGLGLILGVTNVFFRDVSQAVVVALQFWFWLTPIVYPLGTLPASVRDLIAWNPLLPLVTAYQGIVVGRHWPAWGELWPVCVLALLVAGLAETVFRHLSGAMVDEL